MIARQMRDGELDEALSVHPRIIGDELIGRRRAVAAWRSLLSNPAFAHVVLEFDRPVRGCRVAAFGASVFVSSAFVDDELRDPRPGLNARLIATIDAHCSAVVSLAELRRANTFDGLNFVCLAATWRRDALSPEQVAEVEAQMAVASLETFGGYRLRVVVTELRDGVDMAQAEAWRVFKIIRFQPALGGLAVCDRSQALSVPGSVGAVLFHHREPVLGLSLTDQQLLAAAMRGSTDNALADALGVKLATVKKRWASVFDHVAKHECGVVPRSDGAVDRGTRGPQKRHLLLAYLRDHPEELRPHLPQPHNRR